METQILLMKSFNVLKAENSSEMVQEKGKEKDLGGMKEEWYFLVVP